MNTILDRNLTHLRSLLGLNDRHPQSSNTYEQTFGDPTEEIANYKPSLPPEAAWTQETSPEDFERDYQWFLA
jgi:hypothetical protein